MKIKNDEFIRAWLDGKNVEYRWALMGSQWRKLTDLSEFLLETCDFRINPEMFPPRIVCCHVGKFHTAEDINFLFTTTDLSFKTYSDEPNDKSNLRLIFNGITGDLQFAEVLK
jgi:hypothetical protein